MALPYATENQLKALRKEVQNLKRLFYLSNLTPTKVTATIFEHGYVIKGGNLKITTSDAEIIKDQKLGGIIGLSSYEMSLKDAEINNGAKKFKLDIENLKRTEIDDPFAPSSYVLVIDPNRMDWTIKVQDFKLPEDDAEGTVKMDGEVVSWKEIKELLK